MQWSYRRSRVLEHRPARDWKGQIPYRNPAFRMLEMGGLEPPAAYMRYYILRTRSPLHGGMDYGPP